MGDTKACSRCGFDNASHVRFCIQCGNGLAEAEPVAKAPVCWRCYGEGDCDAPFCKFCGASYADDPDKAGEAPSSHAVGPAALADADEGVSVSEQLEARRASFPDNERSSFTSEPPAAEPASVEPAREVEGAVEASDFDSPTQGVQRISGASRDSIGGVQEESRASGIVWGRIVSIMQDGSDGPAYALREEQIDIGRRSGDISFEEDPYLSDRHVRLLRQDGGCLIQDLASHNGVFLRLEEPAPLRDGDVILVGQQVMRFEMLPEAEWPLGPAMHQGVMVFGTPVVERDARLVVLTTEGIGRDVYYLARGETVLGREQGDIIFRGDPFISRRHAVVRSGSEPRSYELADLDSSNGTFQRIRGEAVVAYGATFRVGRHLFRLDRALSS